MIKTYNALKKIDWIAIIKNASISVIAGIALYTPFHLMTLVLDPAQLIITMNSLYFGVLLAVVVTYWQLAVNAFLGIKEYSAVRQLTLGLMLSWVAYTMSVFVSFYYRSTGVDTPASYLTALHRWVIIIAGILQVTAPDFGLGLFHGRDRKILWFSGLSGLSLASIAGYLQWYESLKGFVW